MILLRDCTDVVIVGIDMADYPDFCDATLFSACDSNGEPLTEFELNNIPGEEVHEYICENQLFTD
jgi:hypothetical protein